MALRTVVAAAALATTMPMVAQAAEAPGAGVEVRMARPSWDTGWFQVEVYKEMMRELGYEFTRTITLDNPAFYQAVGQGDVDFWVNGWFPNHETYEDAYSPGAELVGYVAKGGALQGYLVSKSAVETYDIKHLTDFHREEVKEAFDIDGNGKADLVACPPGWGCEEVITHHMDAYNLREHVDPIKANYSASMADALGRHKNGEPVFFYTWTPNWTVGLLEPGKDVMWITVKETRHPRNLDPSQTTVQDLDSCVTQPCNLGWGVSDIRPVVNKEFMAENPAAAKLLEVARIPIEDIFAQNAKMFNGEDDQEDLERHAKTWVESNRDKVDQWLEQARAAAE
jgi:glycine betaine/proline transport system substrate-binding protein